MGGLQHEALIELSYSTSDHHQQVWENIKTSDVQAFHHTPSRCAFVGQSDTARRIEKLVTVDGAGGREKPQVSWRLGYQSHLY